MALTVVNDWRFREDGDEGKGMRAAAEYVDHLRRSDPAVRLSLWIRDRKAPLHFLHIVVFDSCEGDRAQRESAGTRRFAEALFPEIRHETFVQRVGDVVLSGGDTLPEVPLRVGGAGERRKPGPGSATGRTRPTGRRATSSSRRRSPSRTNASAWRSFAGGSRA